jgi:hypothetical protein
MKKASDEIAELTGWAQKSGDEETGYEIKLVEAEVKRQSGSPELAKPLVDDAVRYFSNLGKKESLWLSLSEQARVENSLGKIKECQESAKLALDILKEFAETWPPADYRSYTSRPDNEAARQELMRYGRN